MAPHDVSNDQEQEIEGLVLGFDGYSAKRKNPTPRVTGEWGWKDTWFSEAGLLAATEDLSAKAVICGDGG